MRIALALALTAVAAAFGLGYSVHGHNDHKCHAPCAIILPDNTVEDQFGVDYGWLDHNTPVS